MKSVYKIIVLILFLQFSNFENVCGEIDKRIQYDIQQIKNLPHSEVNVVYEDRRGFIWIGTLDGLFRYDGCDYRTFQIDDTDRPLKSNMILAINEDSAGNIWIGTYGRGVSRVNPQTDEVVNYNINDYISDKINFNDVVSIEIDRDDNMWIANWHCLLKVQLNSETHDIESVNCYPISDTQLQERDFINVIHQDKLGNIWIGSNTSVRQLIEERDGELVCYDFNIACSDICDYDDESIIVAGDDLIMLKCGDDGSHYNSTHLRTLQSSATKVICSDSANIWVGSRHGIAHMNKTSDNQWDLAVRHTKEIMPFDMPASVVSSMIFTKSNQVWVGTRSGGVLTIGRKTKLFNNHPVNTVEAKMPNQIVKALYEDSNGGLWIGTEENGVYYQSQDIRRGLSVTNISVNRTDDRAYAFEQTGDKSTREIMWVGTSFPTNLVAIDINTLTLIDQDLHLPQIGFVFTLRKSDDNTLWAGTYNNGLWRIKIDDYGKVSTVKQFSTLNSSLKSNIIRSLYMSKCGDLFIGTDMGVNRIAKDEIDSVEPQFLTTLYRNKQTTVNEHYVLQITEDRRSNILIGTMGQGMLYYDVDADSLQTISTIDGLANGSVKSIVEDPKNGDIWLSTNSGISKYMPSSGAIFNYNETDGLRDCEFTEICGICCSNGCMVFGNRFGFITFEPKDIQISNVSPKLYFTDLYINYNLVSVGENSSSGRVILDKTLEYTSHIDLEYDERNFSIKFVGINFASPLGNRYQVKLEGMEQKWRDIKGGELVAQYTNVPEGDYKFRVRAANSDGVWSSNELSLGIHINPPLSRSTPAYIVYILLLSLLLYWIYWVLSAITQRKQQVLIAQMEQKRTEEMVQYKLEFFTNISHEFRTPLTLINIPLEKMISKIEGIKDSEMVEDISEMKYNVDMLLL